MDLESKAAEISGRAAFLLPCTGYAPESCWPPEITNRLLIPTSQMDPLSVINDEDLRFETNPKMLPHPPGLLVGPSKDVLAGCLAQIDD